MADDSDFSIASALELTAPCRYRAQLPDGWQQGRGAFGGLVLGVLLRALEAAEPSPARTARTLTGDLCGPVLPGPAEIAVRLLRRGNNQSNVAAELTQKGVVLATATAVLSPPRAAAAPGFTPAPPPPGPPFGELPIVAVAPPPVGPVFTQHYEYRSAKATFASTGDATTDGFIRERTPLGRVDAPALIGRLDAWWPTLFSLDGAPRPVATVSFAAQILVDPASLPPLEPLRHRARMAALSDGFFVELRELWRGDTLVALNQQTFAILR